MERAVKDTGYFPALKSKLSFTYHLQTNIWAGTPYNNCKAITIFTKCLILVVFSSNTALLGEIHIRLIWKNLLNSSITPGKCYLNGFSNSSSFIQPLARVKRCPSPIFIKTKRNFTRVICWQKCKNSSLHYMLIDSILSRHRWKDSTSLKIEGTSLFAPNNVVKIYYVRIFQHTSWINM